MEILDIIIGFCLFEVLFLLIAALVTALMIPTHTIQYYKRNFGDIPDHVISMYLNRYGANVWFVLNIIMIITFLGEIYHDQIL